jgi:hypothetical protein
MQINNLIAAVFITAASLYGFKDVLCNRLYYETRPHF